MMFQPNLFAPTVKPEPPRVGYAICAERPTDTPIGTCTYMESRTVEDAFDWCIYYFPPDEGYIHLSVKNIDTQVERILMPNEFIDRDGTLKPVLDSLTPERKKELTDHASDCTVCTQDCPQCWELYSNIGHDEYTAILVESMT